MNKTQLVLIEHPGHDTDKLKDELYDAKEPYLGLSNYSARALALKAQIEIPKGGGKLPYVMLIENGKVLNVSGVCPSIEEVKWVRDSENPDASRLLVPRPLAAAERTVVVE